MPQRKSETGRLRSIAVGEHLLHITETQSEPGVEPDRMADDIGWEAVTLKGELAHRPSLISICLSSQLAYVTMPVQALRENQARVWVSGLGTARA